MNNLIKEIFSDNDGTTSSMRVMSFLIVLIIVCTWSYTCIRTGTLISFDWPDVGVLMSALGAKAYQKGKETNGGNK